MNTFSTKPHKLVGNVLGGRAFCPSYAGSDMSKCKGVVQCASLATAASRWIALAIDASSLLVCVAGESLCLASTHASVRARCNLMCLMHGFTGTLKISTAINCGQFAEHKSFNLTLGERA